MIDVSNKPKNIIPKMTTVKREICFDELENCKSSDCLQINSIKTFDFHSFDKLLREAKRKQFKTEEEFQIYKKEILNSTSDGTCDLPQISIHGNNDWIILDGKIRLLAYKVLGINPVVEFLPNK